MRWRGFVRGCARSRIALGSPIVLKEEMRASVGLRWWDQVQADLRYGARVLSKSRGATIVAAISLALANGANVTIFSLTKQLLFTRLDVPHAENLRLLTWTGTAQHVAVHHVWGDWNPQPSGRVASSAFAYPVYRRLLAGAPMLDDLFAFKRMGMIAMIGEDDQRVRTELVSGNYFAALNTHPQSGRAIEPYDDAVPGQGAVVVISDEYWDRAFARSPSVLGRQIKLNDITFTVVGVAPSGFTGVKDTLHPADFFLPLSNMVGQLNGPSQAGRERRRGTSNFEHRTGRHRACNHAAQARRGSSPARPARWQPRPV